MKTIFKLVFFKLNEPHTFEFLLRIVALKVLFQIVIIKVLKQFQTKKKQRS